VATPQIGTTISDGYAKGFDRLASHAASVAVPSLAIAVIVGIIAHAQAQFVPDVGEMLSSVLSGKQAPQLSSEDRAAANGLGALSSAVQVFATYAGLALFAGAFHRARHRGDDHAAEAEVPDAGACVPAMLAAAGALMPKLGLLIVLSVIGPLAGIISEGLGGIVTLVSFIALVYLSVRWVYASVIAGAGEHTGDAAFDRSAQAVEGSWWGTFGVWLVVSLATLLPIIIVGGIVGAIVPGAFLSSLASTAIVLMGTYTIYGSALESGWAQVEGGERGKGGFTPIDATGMPTHPGPAPVSPEPASPAAAPYPGAEELPTTHPSGDDLIGDDDRERGPFS